MPQSWMLNAIREALDGSSYDSDPSRYRVLGEKPGKDPQGNPKFSKIAQGVIFSQKFILTYHAVVVALLLLFTILHWSAKVARAWRARRRSHAARATSSKSPASHVDLKKDSVVVFEEERSGSSSSGSSTAGGVSGSRTSRQCSSTEMTPLIATTQPKPPAWRIIPRLRAILMYQPPPIKYVSKVLPSIATTLFILAFVGLNVFYTLYACPLTIGPATFVLADRASVLFVANLPLLYLLSAKNQPIKFLSGYSYEALNIFHRRLGEMLCLLALLHTAGMTVVWYTILRPIGWSFWYFVTQKIILLGLVAFICYELLYFTSLASFRQRWYELFLVSHVVLQTAALILVWFHHPRSRIYVGIALGIFLSDRLLFRMLLKTRFIQARLNVAEDGHTALIQAEWSLPQDHSIWRSVSGLEANYKAGWNATEHIFLTVPSLSRQHVFQAHPFTIASSAPANDDKIAALGLIVRAQDGFSKHLVKYAKTHSKVEVKLEGPYGSQTAVELLRGSDCAIVVAGGSGIAVAHPAVAALLQSQTESTETGATEAGDKKDIGKKIYLVWITNQASHTSWLSADQLDKLRAAGVELILPPPTSQAGRPDVAQIVEDCVTQYTAQTLRPGKIGVVCSGPDAMNRSVRNRCASLAWRGRDVDVEIEKFGW